MMNERFRQLARQAHAEYVKSEYPGVDVPELPDSLLQSIDGFLSRFAEKIIEECRNQVPLNSDLDVVGDWHDGFFAGATTAVDTIDELKSNIDA